jgi:alkylglycerol monooxygenase
MKDLILLLAIPFFIFSIFLELWWDNRRGTGFYHLNDAFSSLTLGIMSRSSQLLIFSLGGVVIDTLLPEYRLFEWDSNSLWTWVFTFVAYDFAYYWFHRTAHSLNFFWAGHAIHHQSEEYNLTTALRQTSSSMWTWIFGLPVLMLGVPLEVYLTCGALNLIYQFWVHTRHIGKLGWMESVMVTPSNHRVHHAQNPEYIDKNHGGVFIIWDRIFGSFQSELDDIEIIYGVRRPLHSLNPLWANVYVWWYLIKDAWHAKSWWDKCRIWFMPTGWRPADVEEQYPLVKSDLQAFEKFDPPTDNKTRIYTVFQLTMAVPLLAYFLVHFASLNFIMVMIGFFIITLPFVTTAWLIEGRGRRGENVRLLLSWLGYFVAWQVMSTTSLLVFGGYLLLNSIALILLWGFHLDSVTKVPDVEQA